MWRPDRMMTFKKIHSFVFNKLSKPKEKIYEWKSLDQLVSSSFLFQLKLDSLPGHDIFIDFGWLSCAVYLTFID